MAKSALEQLFQDLDADKVEPLSGYEQRLHDELSQLLSQSDDTKLSDLFKSFEVRHDLKAEGYLKPTDTTRLRCLAPNCPNKRR